MLWITGVSLAISFLYFIRVYRQLLYPAYDWYFEIDVPRLEIAVALFCSLTVFFLFFGVLLLIRSQDNGLLVRILRIVFIVSGVLAFCPLSTELLTWWFTDPEVWFKYVMPLVVLVICILLPRKGSGLSSRVVKNLELLLLITVPASILVFAHALFLLTGIETKDLEPRSIETTNGTAKSNDRLHRVVWVIFDELDFSALSTGTADVHLPAFEELQSGSFVAENAFPPHNWTSVSIPALLTGKIVDFVEPHGPDDLTLHFRINGSAVELNETDTVFDDVLSLNGKVAAAGWYHPYPRLFRNKLSIGYWISKSTFRCQSSVECILSTFGRAFREMPSPEDVFLEKVRKDFLSYREHAKLNSELQERSMSLVANENLDLVFLHLATPRGPYLKRNGDPSTNYFESLEAADETLSAITESIKTAKLWDRTTLIVSSDHWNRSSLESRTGQDPNKTFALNRTRIPFIVKLAGGKSSTRYDKRLNTVITRSLIQSLMNDELSTMEEFTTWLDRIAKEHPELMNFHPCPPNEASSLGSPQSLVTCN